MRTLVACFVGVVTADLNFLAVGDWGEDNVGEYADAAGMETVGESLKPEFAVMLGDNFYGSGIHGSEYDPRFKKTFEDVYNGKYLETIPFYAIAGNHDHGGNVSAQISYSAHSKRWKYPDWYYSVKYDIPGSDKKFEMLLFDSVIGLGNSDDNEDKFSQPPGPADPPAAAAQWAWLEAAMANSTAEYLWIGGHYPVWSACSHGPTQGLVQKLKPMLEKYGAHYMSGHDHCMGHIDEGKGPQYIMTGAGMECCYAVSNVDKNPANSIKFWVGGQYGSGYQPMPFKILSGFTSMRLTDTAMTVVYHAHNGSVLYTTPPIAPRHAPWTSPPTPVAPLPTPPPPTPPPAPTPFDGCYIDGTNNGITYIGGNIFGDHHIVNSTATADACCKMCAQYSKAEDGHTACTFFQWDSASCYGVWPCCRLKSSVAWAGRGTGGSMTATTGSILPLPKPPAPPGLFTPAQGTNE